MGEPWMDDPAPIDLPDDLRARIKLELAPDEQLLWASRPSRAMIPPWHVNYAMLGAGSVGLLGLSLAAVVLSRHLAPRHPEAGYALIALGIIAGLSGFAHGFIILITLPASLRDRRLRRGRIYALTDRRAIVWSPVAGSEAVTVHVYPRGSIRPEQIERTQFPDGSGTLAFQGPDSPGGRFEGVADVRRVEDHLVRRYLVAGGPPSTP